VPEVIFVADVVSVVALAARPVIAVAARLVTGAATETVPSVPIVTLEPCFTPPSTEDVATGSKYADGVPDKSEYFPDVATVARPVIAVAARLVTGAATETVPSVPIVTLDPCFTPPRTEAVATGKLYDDGAPDRSEYFPDVATVASPVIAVADNVVTGAATEIVPSDAIVVFEPCFTPPRTEAVAAGRL
jgi:F420-0:gamma-glutamyl ligase